MFKFLIIASLFCINLATNEHICSRRRCIHSGMLSEVHKREPFYRKSVLESALCLIFFSFLGVLFLLLLFGIIKGLIGLFLFRPIGEFGLSLLIDLPKPLERYQEYDLYNRPVVYDIGGWPVHPDTGLRSVQVLPNNIEFCLNVIFFLAYPLALCVQLCGLCCCIRPQAEYDDTICYQQVNVIKLTKCPINIKDTKKKSCIGGCSAGGGGGGPTVDKYEDNDEREPRDTEYVVNEMQRSHTMLLEEREKQKQRRISFERRENEKLAAEEADNSIEGGFSDDDEFNTTKISRK